MWIMKVIVLAYLQHPAHLNTKKIWQDIVQTYTDNLHLPEKSGHSTSVNHAAASITHYSTTIFISYNARFVFFRLSACVQALKTDRYNHLMETWNILPEGCKRIICTWALTIHTNQVQSIHTILSKGVVSLAPPILTAYNSYKFLDG